MNCKRLELGKLTMKALVVCSDREHAERKYKPRIPRCRSLQFVRAGISMTSRSTSGFIARHDQHVKVP